MRLAMRKGKEGKGSDGSNTWGREMAKYVKGKSAVAAPGVHPQTVVSLHRPCQQNRFQNLSFYFLSFQEYKSQE